MIKIFIALFPFFMTFNLFAQYDSLLAKVAKIMEQIEAGTGVHSIPKSILIQNTNVLLPILSQYEKTNNQDIQLAVFSAYYEIATDTKDGFLRKKMVNGMLRACNDTTIENYACHPISNELKQFNIDDFDENARKAILQKLKFKNPEENIILIAGAIQLTEAIGTIKRLSLDNSYYNKWQAKLALARMGDKSMISECVKTIKLKLKDDDSDVSAFNELYYLKQKDAIPIFESYLNREDALDPEEGKKRGQPYNDFGLRWLASLVEGFPIRCNSPGSCSYGTDDIAKCRKWMKENKGKYKIRRDTF